MSSILGSAEGCLRCIRRLGNRLLELLGSRSRRLVGIVGIEGLAVAQRVILSVIHCCCVEVAILDEQAPAKTLAKRGVCCETSAEEAEPTKQNRKLVSDF